VLSHHSSPTAHSCLARRPSARRAAILRCLAALSVLTLFVLAAIAPPALADEWKGKEDLRDGARYMVNPNEPMQSSLSSTPKELWRIGGDTDDEDEFFGVITQLLTDEEGNVYLLDSQLNQVKVFSAAGKLLRTIGREGEGPGEFRNAGSMFFTRDGKLGVLQAFPGRIVLFTPEGEPAGDHPIPARDDGGMVLLFGGASRAGNVVLVLGSNAFAENRFDQSRYLAGLTPEGKEAAKYYEDTRTIDFANPVLDDSVWDTWDRRWTIGVDGRVYVCTDFLNYRIQVWNVDGTTDRVIEREYSHLKRTADEMKMMEDIFTAFTRQIPNATVKISDVNKDIDTIFAREDGTLWVLSSRGTHNLPPQAAGVFDVFDRDGRFARQVTLHVEGDPRTDAYYFVGDRFYVVTDLLQAAIALQAGGQSITVGDEEPEPMSVVCYQLGVELQMSKQ
jgi:hypothetical protein